MFRPVVVDIDQDAIDPMVYRYDGMNTHHHTSELTC